MTAHEGFETRPVPVGQKGITSPTLTAFAELPLGIQMLCPRGGAKNLNAQRNALTNLLNRHFPGRKIHASIDEEKDGVWIWWEERIST